MTGVDEGLLAPVTVGHDHAVGDAAVLAALVRAEAALVGAYADIGMLSAESLSTIDAAFAQVGAEIDVARLAADAVAAGNPIIPLVARLKHPLADDLRLWVHRGATSQDIVDTALMIVASEAVALVHQRLADAGDALERLAQERGGEVVAARTLTQHAVPLTIGARIDVWRRALARASSRLDGLELPAQLSGAAGTSASFVEITGSADGARALAAAFARRAGLLAIDGSWQVTRWPVTELGDALVQAVDALGKLAADVATLGRTEIGELSEGAGGGSSAMPQKQNPVASTLIRSAALRAPQLGATLHLAAALAVDERPDGAWHAEWPALRELLRLALGASAHGASLAAGLRVDRAAGARNLALSGGLIVSERLAIVLVPLIGRARFDALIAEVSAGGDLRAALQALPEDIDVDDLLDPAKYTGLPQTPVPERPSTRRSAPRSGTEGGSNPARRDEEAHD
ncbi:lyase family protein [Microbacterium sp. ZW T5_45]|uniref:lyase family protein n=1 Tax=Microbacterium sp. ZW T5_45 TaxID=3378080 RepID=UPI003853CA9C